KGPRCARVSRPGRGDRRREGPRRRDRSGSGGGVHAETREPEGPKEGREGTEEGREGKEEGRGPRRGGPRAGQGSPSRLEGDPGDRVQARGEGEGEDGDGPGAQGVRLLRRPPG